ncbi:MAG: pentapeptide repeat-containing protein [Alphaproteobacteria bacterium]|nr:pentapeptide repeat-containing protein [Alphaproteobacteria bacterium]
MKPALTFTFILLAADPVLALDYVGAKGADPVAVARIRADIVDCPGCKLMGADLSNTCVKEHDLHGANFDSANATLMCMSFADFRGASFRGTELSGANLAGAKMDGADLTGAITSITSFAGTDLRGVKGLTQKQLDLACSDKNTKLPAGLKPHFCK